MNIGQGLATFGQEIGNAIRRKREKEDKKKETDEMVQTLKQMGIDPNIADLIKGDKELFNNYVTLKGVQHQESQIQQMQQRIDQQGQPPQKTPAQLKVERDEEEQGDMLLQILGDPKSAKATYGVYANNWKGGGHADARAFHKIYSNKSQPETTGKSVLNAFLEDPNANVDELVQGDPTQLKLFAQSNGTSRQLSELSNIFSDREEDGQFVPVPTTVSIPGGGEATYLPTSRGSGQYQFPDSGDQNPTANMQNNEAVMNAVREGNVKLVELQLANYMKVDPTLGTDLTPEFVYKLIDEAKANAKKKK